MLTRKMKLLCGVILLSAALSVSAQTPLKSDKRPAGVPELRQEASRAFQARDYQALKRALEQLRVLRPNNSEYMYQMVLAYALLDEKSAAYDTMLKMQRQGLSYDFNQSPESQNIRGTQLYDYLNDLMISAGLPLGSVTPVATLPADVILPEAIAWDSSRDKMLIGTIASGSIFSVAKNGKRKKLVKADSSNGIWGIYGLAVDAKRNRLWASSSASQQFSGFDPANTGRSELLEFELDSMKLIHHHPVPVDGRHHYLGNLAITANGDVYVADSLLPVIYVKKSDEDQMKPFFASNELVSLRGLTRSDDSSKLYVADYEMGIVVIDIEAGMSAKLKVPETLNLGGIDGLNYFSNQLIIIQNGVRPERVMSLELDPEGVRVVNIAPVAVALDIMNSPNYGTIAGEDLLFFANSHWASMGGELPPVTIVSTSLVDLPQIVDHDAKRLMEQYQKAHEMGAVKEGKLRPPVANPDSGNN